MDGSIETQRWLAFLPMVTGFCSHQTTRKTDETLCAATVLGIDTSPLLKITKDCDHDEESVADLRMKLLYITQIQSFIIFNCRPRSKKDGCRWAPRSMMGYSQHDLGGFSVYTHSTTAQTHHQWGPEASNIGLRVTYPGIKLELILEIPGPTRNLPW